MAYVYKHIRLDKNIPFYIGVGSDKMGKYERAYNFKQYHRNKVWTRIYNKTKISVEIVSDNITWEDAVKKEIELIAFYKRINDGGILCNITLGGEGVLGFSLSEESRKKMSETKKGKYSAWNKGKKQSTEHRLKNSLTKMGKPAWNKGIPMSEEHKIKMAASKKGKPSWNKGKKMTEEYKLSHPQNKQLNKIIQLDINGNIVNEYKSTFEASEKTGFPIDCIRMASRSQYSKKYINKYRGFIWKQKSPTWG